jgi:puromycin-sensitive aminopeptidase
VAAWLVTAGGAGYRLRMTSTHYRLPRHVIPLAYHVHLEASPRRRGFSGTLVCQLKVMEACESFELNARGLKVAAAGATQRNKNLTGKVKLHPDRETVAVHFADGLKKGPVEVRLTFKGQLNPSMHGLYLAKDGPERAIVSQCEAADARAIFPCFDEPDLKATLQWTVSTDPGLEVITNGALVGRRKARGAPRVVHNFAATRVIPTYLAAITIGKLEGSPTQKVAGTPCRIWCGPKKQAQTAFAEAVTAQVLPWYQKYFGQKYNYGKLDQVAVPGFDAGAMENVGAIFYRQNLLLMQPGTTSWQAQKRIAEVIAHEIAHQWFGNLVTMKWWDDLWLNEAFATWIAYKACDVWRPDWRMWDDYLESKESALAADALLNTHPIYNAVHSPAEATELFDVITYEKGCGVLRMAESFLGEATFRDGIRRYQAAYKNKNAAGADLWAKLGEASGKPMLQLMQSWITQPGFPLVHCSLKAHAGKAELKLSQRRFFASPKEMAKANDQTWTIPLIVQYDAGDGQVQTHRVLMAEREMTVALPTAKGHTVRWAYPNADAVSFLRLDFDAPTRRALLKPEVLAALSPASRMSLITDQWANVRCGRAPVDALCEVLQAFSEETDHAVMRTLSTRLHTLAHNVAGDADQAAMGRFAQSLCKAQLQALGFESTPGEAPTRGVQRACIVGLLGDLAKDPEVLAEAHRQVDREVRNPAGIDANLAGVWVSLTAKDGNKALLERYVQVYQKRKRAGMAPELQARYLYALGAFERPEVVGAVLKMCLDGTIPQEQLRVIISPLLSRRTSGPQAWTFLKKHWQVLAPQVGSMGISRLVESTGGLPYSLRGDVASFFQKNPVAEAERALKKALEGMDLWHDLQQREAPRLRAWLKKMGY